MIMRSEKTEKLAAIDIGTNSTRLLAVHTLIKPCKKILYPAITREMQITRLGKNTGRTGIISPESSRRTIEVLGNYCMFLKNKDIRKYRVVGTRVLRQAKNSGSFVEMVYHELGVKVEIISGVEEARLSYMGASGAQFAKLEDEENKQTKNILVIDVGGGSTELILGTSGGKINHIESIDIGSVILSEKFLLHSKPRKTEILELEDFINKKLMPVLSKVRISSHNKIIGLAGTISTLASIDLSLKHYDRDKIHGYCMTRERIRDIYERLCATDLEGRKMIAGLQPGRADIIIGGAAIVVKIMELLHVEAISVSESDILEGIIYSIF